MSRSRISFQFWLRLFSELGKHCSFLSRDLRPAGFRCLKAELTADKKGEQK